MSKGVGDMTGRPGKGGRKGRSGGARPKVREDDGRGRPPKSYTIKAGSPLMISQVYPDGYADLGRGQAEIRKVGTMRVIAVPQDDGSEIRIVIV